MIAAIRAELISFRRPRLAFGVLGAMVLLGILATVVVLRGPAKTTSLVFNSARPAAVRYDLRAWRQPRVRLRLHRRGGIRGVVILILFTARHRGGFGRRNAANLVLLETHRLHVIAGKALALALFAAVGFLLAEIAATATVIVLAQIRGISTADWFTGEGLRIWISAYGGSNARGSCLGTRRRRDRHDLPIGAPRTSGRGGLVLPIREHPA